MTAIVVLGMHRSGTSALAGMLATAGVASAGPAVRNWDNARGHFEALALVRLNESVLARAGGHWLAAPAEVRWTEEQARARDRLLAERVEGRAALLKDPRTLLVLPFWRAARVPFHALGILRHPLAVARSLASWRGLPLAEGLALWTAHNRALRADHEQHGFPLIDFDRSGAELAAAVARACERFGLSVDPARLATAHDERLVHHDENDDEDDDKDHDEVGKAGPGIEEALALHAALVARADSGPRAPRARFPRASMAAFQRALATRDHAAALEHARAALRQAADASAVLLPAVAALVRARAHDAARALVLESSAALEPGLADLLLGKILFAAGDARAAVARLEAACAVPEPFYQARRLLPQALRRAGRRAEARRALTELAGHALYPHDPLSQLAEWAWSDGEPALALAQMARAIEAAPLHRRGRMRTRRAAWLAARGARAEAEDELEQALGEDPSYPRASEALARLRRASGAGPV